MIDVKLPVELPAIDLSNALPLLALVLLAALILITLTARSVLQSRALAIVAVAAIIIGGSSSIIGGLQAVAGLILVTGLITIGLIVTLGRTPDVLDVVRTLVDRPTITIDRPAQSPTQIIDAPQPTYQLPAAGQTVPAHRRARSGRLPRGLGF